ncbi:MAG: caspase family protein [Bacteroidaceae bacterium]|nr:caspase family protein [Bacteroidaceae bacterium]
MFISSFSFAQRKRAFLVGISHYDTALTGYQWNNINGVNDVELLSPILLNQGFQIVSLLDKEATFEAIIKQLSLFVKKSKAGDIVYLHFSTHGQPVEDISGDEADGWDEAIVPIDAYKQYRKGLYEGEHHLLDDQLNTSIKQLRSKLGAKGFLYVTIDACHAGTSSRGNDDIIRGTRVGFTSRDKVFKPNKDKRSHYQIQHSNKMADVVFIEACRADQVNTEIKIDGKRYGALSYHLAKAIQKESISKHPSNLLSKLKTEILQQGSWPNSQNLVIEKSIPQ